MFTRRVLPVSVILALVLAHPASFRFGQCAPGRCLSLRSSCSCPPPLHHSLVKAPLSYSATTFASLANTRAIFFCSFLRSRLALRSKRTRRRH